MKQKLINRRLSTVAALAMVKNDELEIDSKNRLG